MEESKQDLRDHFKSKRLELSEEDRKKCSAMVVEKIRKMDVYKQSKIVALYHPIFNEVDLLELLQDDKTFCFPKIISFANSEMDFFEPGSGFKDTIFGIEEPEGNYVSKENIDLILVPGLVFSKDGYRIGYGKGFYDKYLKGVTRTTIGIAYGFQVVEKVPHGENDIQVSLVVSSEGRYV